MSGEGFLNNQTAPLVLLSRKGQSRPILPQQPQLSVKTHHAQETVASSSSSPAGTQQPKNTRMSASVVFVNDEVEIANFIQSYILNDNREYTVIGAIGLQGTGKSTFLSMLAGNQTLDKYRQYIFRPCSRDTIYSGLYQTNGLHVYVTESRTIYIDCKPFNCSAIFEEQIRKIRSDTANLSIYKNTQIEGLTLLGLMFELCDTILFNIDWFIDVNAVQEVLRAALFSEFNFRKYSDYPKTTNMVIVHQRAKTADFEMTTVKKRARIIKSMFKDTKYDVCGGVSLANLGFTEYVECEPDVNYIVLDDLPQWSKEPTVEDKLIGIPYDTMLKRLRPALHQLKKHNFRNLNKSRPMRRRTRGQKLYLPPTLDPKRAGQLRKEHTEHERGNRNADEERIHDFNPEHFPNITKWKGVIPVEPWNENLGFSVLSPPSSETEALKSLNLLVTTHARNNDYVESLLPGVDQERYTELQWFDYTRAVLDVAKKAFATKYFISNNGRVAPRLVRKLPNSAKFLYSEPKLQDSQKRPRRKNTKTSDEGLKKEEEKFDENEPAVLEEHPHIEEEVVKAETSDEDLSSQFDETSSEEEESASESSNSSDDNSREKNFARRTRRKRISDAD